MVVGFTRTRVGEREHMLGLCSEGVWPARRISVLSVRGMEEMGSAPWLCRAYCSSAGSMSSRNTSLQQTAQPGLWNANASLGLLNGAFLSPQRGEMRGRKEFWF